MSCESSVLLADLYQFTMLKGFFEQRMDKTAVFEFYVRRLPQNRSFLMAAGLEQVLSFLEQFRFEEEDLQWLSKNQKFDSHFLDYLRQLRFTGHVDAMPEGTIFFANEPILRVTAPLPIGQFIETRLINLLQFQTLIASKAARCVLAAPGKTLVDFGLRRAHGREAGLLAARASYLAGFAGTSNVLAGKEFGIPLSGTMAHCFVQAHESEEKAFEDFACCNPENAVFLLDTYDTEAAARKIIKLSSKLKAQGKTIKAVRLDSGDLADLARKVRNILDQGGLRDVRILASGNLEEEELSRLFRAGAPIDGFGVGTRLVTSWDAPYLECVYKLMEYDGRPIRKYSEGKATWPGRKQIYRKRSGAEIESDTLALEGESIAGEAMLVPVMREGRRVAEPPSLEATRVRASQELNSLPKSFCGLDSVDPFPVNISPCLAKLAREMEEQQFKKSPRR